MEALKSVVEKKVCDRSYIV